MTHVSKNLSFDLLEYFDGETTAWGLIVDRFGNLQRTFKVRLNGNIDLSQINLNNIERIEIVEGPLSTIYGTDALGGTIKIISKKTRDARKNINTYYETI